MAKAHKETPLNKQYNQIKAKYPGALLLFRVGDFYETFGEDAVRASKILGIVLTRRNNGGAHEELAGFPHHSLDNYLPKLVRAGERVAICDQLEDPAAAKGIVKRGVTELVTPGVSFNDNVLDIRKNNYLAAIHVGSDGLYGIAFLDISTGEFMASQGNAAYVDKMLQGFGPAEVLYCKKHKQEFNELFGGKYHTFHLEDWCFGYDYGYEQLTGHFQTTTLKGYGIESLPLGIIAAGVILHYLRETEHKEVAHISRITRLEEEKYVWLDRFTVRNLELVYAQQEGGVPLIDILDHTVTPMGARQLRKWMVLPLKDKAPVEERLSAVAHFLAHEELHESLVGYFKQIGDLERLISKVAVRRINPRELVQLKKSLKQIAPVKELLTGGMLDKFAAQLDACGTLVDKIERELRDDAPVLSNQGRMIQSGVDSELDELHAISYEGKDYLIKLQNREIERTGIGSLKIAYNKVFGYYLEVTHAHQSKVPSDWIRKQTLVNAERYITPELKEYEEKIMNAEDRISAIEFRIFSEIVQTASEYVAAIQQNAQVVSALDVLSSFALAARKNKYVQPVISEGNELDIKEGRHPVIEQQLPVGESYVPNDVYLDDASQQIIIITGPNMAGKSALLRQTALIVLMAQMGSFVPAKSATIGLVDKVFTRVGASDNLSKGESTFMVEMTETASILNNLSSKSLVLMDEIGRGTSTYDGVSIAWAITEYLHSQSNCRPKTLFATHYHELNQLAEDFPRIKNFNVAVKEVDNKVVFLRKLKPGGSAHSFGIHVAQIAGMPQPIVLRASEIMQHLEKDHVAHEHKKRVKDIPKNNFQLSIFEPADPKLDELKEKLLLVDVNTLSPIEALLKLNEFQKLIKK
ncbi:DNA mismatch repair protein MutS [Dyadobacter sp. BE34]|uniref:DNA mismatch repair protein MutS n=1 Tax=Dyadobacter fermentans TaxID=94254 RepID=A0ABU1R3Y9_9BACT|nr:MULTISPECIES: DNA mismatch repair protein MutS [Dyadobacter]MDR6808139.1 DNA mismatch repair protein MutS [Dyadobacter fermentans]MDR7046045.1 DNA mismatch repair protein MutS [Dyadobacter sp. BE242]MDR7200358.1 DNA mismatch repair protein MutS [Dyadobacter sp. BE34]MDR7218318.1 DNA mismatch repair protein MutS [Dyadobacter sp. BE31]MDR7266249.1 DNA mismatch repair protein MutS [Dyadobacter sp. BE32]